MSEEQPNVAGKRLGFEVSSERGCAVVTLADGAILHVHPIVVDVMHMGKNERGEPIYTLAGGLAVRLMQQPKEESE